MSNRGYKRVEMIVAPLPPVKLAFLWNIGRYTIRYLDKFCTFDFDKPISIWARFGLFTPFLCVFLVPPPHPSLKLLFCEKLVDIPISIWTRFTFLCRFSYHYFDTFCTLYTFPRCCNFSAIPKIGFFVKSWSIYLSVFGEVKLQIMPKYC